MQQLVVQDFHLALRTVGDVEHDGPVIGIGQPGRQLGQRQQIADVGLQLRQHRWAGAVIEQVDARQVDGQAVGPAVLGLVKPIQLAHEVAALPAPGGQQRMGMAMHRRQRHLRQIALAAQGIAWPGGAQQLTAFQDVSPVVAAGVGHGQQHLGVRGQRGQRHQRLARQMGSPEQHHPPGQRRHRGLAPGQRSQKIRMHLGPDRSPLGRAQIGQQRPPQQRLPALIGRQRLGLAGGADQRVIAPAPGSQPIGPVDLVLVQQIGQPAGQLQAPVGRTAGHTAGRLASAGRSAGRLASAGRTATQESCHRLKARLRHPAGQAAHQAPDQRVFVQG